MAPASFSSFPPELVSKICSDPGLEKKDLIALRLTSKAHGINASATKAFGKRYFTMIPLLYSEYSLETFVKICQHPIFCACIRNVELSCARTGPRTFDSTLRHMTNFGWTRSFILEQAQSLAARCDNEERFDIRDAQALLVRAFTQLADSYHSIALAVSTDESYSIGAKKVYQANTETNR
ncbi:hypothetical protein KCU89_g7692, partial [Aureobasidium melanogenum]